MNERSVLQRIINDLKHGLFELESHSSMLKKRIFELEKHLARGSRDAEERPQGNSAGLSSAIEMRMQPFSFLEQIG